jgi:tetratricopeptide (TPR) repeat protein
MNTTRMEQLQDLLRESPGDAFLIFAIAKEYEGGGQLAEALQHYEQLGALDPGYVGLYYHWGKLLEQLGRSAEAGEVYDRGLAVAKSAGDRHAWSELSAARMDMDI